MKFIIVSFCIYLCTISQIAYSQETCTVATSGNWSGGGSKATWNCTGTASEPEDPNVSTVIVPNGKTLTIKTNVTWNASVIIEDGGIMEFENQLSLGEAQTGCGYTFIIESGGSIVDSGTGANDRLYICGETILSSAPNPPSPAVDWPAGGFDGPTGFDEEGEDATLPVELVFFKANTLKEAVQLTWATASEFNNDYFTLEKSRNGKDFEVVALLDGNGTQSSLSNYNYVDQNPLLGLSYYQLSQTDFDGTTEVFPMISVLYKGNIKNFSIYPNPITKGDFTLRATARNQNEKISLNILNLQGQIMQTKKISADAFGNLDFKVQLDNAVQKGIYLIELNSKSKKEHIRIIVE